MGTVQPYPDYVADFTGRERFSEVSIWVTTLAGGVEQPWVEFDKRQLDGDGDGPYIAGVIDVPALERLVLK